LGSKKIELSGNIKSSFIFDSSKRPGCFIPQAYGAMRFKIEITGRAAHLELEPGKGISAIEVAARSISNLKLGRVGETVTANVGPMSGGSAINNIPEIVVLSSEVRALDPKDVEATFETIKTTFIEAVDYFSVHVCFEDNWDFTTYHVTDEEFVYQEVSRTIESIGLTPKPIIN